MKRPELLAPAGSYDSFLGALCAGADAVYIGGEKFGARAYADNFTQDEICSAIRYAHLLDKKVYLTVNTLMKQNEMEELYEYLQPFYQCGLDAVIVQDFGVVKLVRECFPKMELHISTQMTVTGVHSAKLMKQWGADRVVPARELSLEEVQRIRNKADIEVETFIHGSLCYSYSGQCLFSSILGGRSGNRGRCAQPCRLPYGSDNTYPLSLKDMCTIEILPALIEAGIDSFKIEGRMKKPEYAAGVTAIYRKYIDRYLHNPDEPYRVEKEDMDCLRQLYMRSGLLDGYYNRHNGREMITMERPGYAGSSEALSAHIQAAYLKEPLRIPVTGKLQLEKERPVELTLEANGQSVNVAGDVVMQAKKQPLLEDAVRKQIGKTGNTSFKIQNLELHLESDAFLPVRSLNELRRDALERLTEKLLKKDSLRPSVAPQPYAGTGQKADKFPALYAAVSTLEQGLAVLSVSGLNRIYLPADCLLENEDASNGYRFHHIAQQKLMQWTNAVSRQKQKQKDLCIYLSLPIILRERDETYLKTVKELLCKDAVDGILVCGLEGYAWLKEQKINKPVVLDANLYLWNEEAAALFAEEANQEGWQISYTLPIEADRQQLRRLAAANRELIVYGRSPMMVSANCLYKTCEACLLTKAKTQKPNGLYELTDRYRKKFPVNIVCRHCYNIIYNSLPTSLHRELEQIKQWGLEALRVQFTTETAEEAVQIAAWYQAARQGEAETMEFVLQQTTRGHFKNGVE